MATITTRKIADAGDLLTHLPTPHGALSWVSDGDGLVGWGEAVRVTTSGPDRFAQAQQWWTGFTARHQVRDEVGLLGTGPVAFTSMAFADRPGHSVLIVPKVVVGRRDGVSWMTTVGDPTTDIRPVTAPTGVRYGDGEVNDDAHRRSVAAAVARIRGGSLGKVVIARDLLATADAPLDERHLLRRLAAGYPTCWVYAVDGLVGATPELMLRRDGDQVSARLLAGTVWPEPGTNAADLGRALLASTKNREEHEFAIRSLEQSLGAYCSSLDVPDQPSLLPLPNLTHLATDVRGTLRADVPLLELAGCVHPTAAVGGTPSAAAMQAIGDLELMDRGGYLGPVGWLDANGNGELGVALRCAQVSGDTARLFAGGGIVAESDPETEAAEVVAKFRVMRSALEA